MGARSSQPEAPPPYLTDLGERIGVIQTFAQHDDQLILRLREQKSSWSSKKFSVENAITGEQVFHVDSKKFSAQSRKIVQDAGRQPLFILKKTAYSIQVSYDGFDAKDQRLFSVTAAGGPFGQKQLYVRFKNNLGKGEWIQIHIRGDWLNRNASVTLSDGTPIAHVSRLPLKVGEIVFDRQTYYLMVAPGFDSALMVGATICMNAARARKFDAGNSINFAFSG
ncbi:hypothetical protein K437DRAFT_270698 [Tilletiaria anomala UBC 951]|uniref:DUF567-domain-containing protein n=1 Tax=Tilletiaria anomala (strain ATCC 24038 / CBS 436.72 / UBC 951) TaxID=1037660 RepID=A0A066V8C7_TILAU|nr:uncharacterized protein K437DRAFT_270698 [Tilletiaria anomala UBC 951]KDN37987.1 hypothetical protein K437DRAFT_270698 [Tilletiaria anomala UBC 951]